LVTGVQTCALPIYYGTFRGSGLDSLVANTVDPTTGALTALPGYAPPPVVESGPGPPTIDPFGRFLYSLYGDDIAAYAINPAREALHR
jgi:hypothetical protein